MSISKKDLYILVRKGLVQRWIGQDANGNPAKVWPVAESHEDAARLAKWLNKPGVRPARIGSIQGETLDRHIVLALKEGCVAAYCVAGWRPDGSPEWKSIPFAE